MFFNINIYYMLDTLFAIIHYVIGFIILGFLIWLIIKVHNYLSKDNIPFETMINKKSTVI